MTAMTAIADRLAGVTPMTAMTAIILALPTHAGTLPRAGEGPGMRADQPAAPRAASCVAANDKNDKNPNAYDADDKSDKNLDANDKNDKNLDAGDSGDRKPDAGDSGDRNSDAGDRGDRNSDTDDSGDRNSDVHDGDDHAPARQLRVHLGLLVAAASASQPSPARAGGLCFMLLRV